MVIRDLETTSHEIETDTKNVVSRPYWSRELNIPGGAYSLTSVGYYILGKHI